MKPLRISMVCNHYYPFVGGVESHVQQISERLVARGHQVEVFTQQDPQSPRHDSEERGVFVRRFPVPVPSTNFAVAPGLLAALRSRRASFDVLHAHGYHTSVPVMGALAVIRPMVFTPHYHGTGHSQFRKILHRPYRVVGGYVAAAARYVICVSEAEAELFVRHFPSAEPRVKIIPNGIDLPAIQSAQPLEGRPRCVLAAGRLESYKNVDRTIAAVAHIPGCELLITGDGPDRQRLEAAAKLHGVAERVSFLGRIDVTELYRWFRTVSVYVSMSTNEAMPVTVSEVLAGGARVVLSDIPAHRDIARRTRGAIEIVSSHATAADLAAAIQRGMSAKSSPSQRLATWDEVVDDTVAIYDAALR